MKDTAVAMLVAVAVVAIGAGIVYTAPGLQKEAVRNARRADTLTETARRRLVQYQPSLAFVGTFLPEADWHLPDADTVAKQVESHARQMEQIDQVLRQLHNAYQTGRTNVPEGSRDSMLAWGFPEPLIEDTFHFAGQAGKRAGEYRSKLNREPPGPSSRLIPGLGAGPQQQSRVLSDAVETIRRKYAANRNLLVDAAAQLAQAIALLPNHIAANRLMAMVEYQWALQQRFEGLGLRRLAERLRPRILELVGSVRTVRARAAAVRNQRNLQLALEQLHRTDQELRSRLDRQQQAVSRLQGELTARRQELEAKRLEAERTRQAYDQALQTPWDTGRPATFAEHLRLLQQAGRAMSAAAATLEAAEKGTVTGVQLDPPGDLLAGRYVPASATTEEHYVRSIAAIARELAGEQLGLERTRSTLEDVAARGQQLQEVQNHLAAELDRYEQQIDALMRQVNDLLDDLERLVAEAETAEAKGLADYLEKALGHLQAAQRGSARRISEGRLDLMGQERWLTAGLEALEGEVRLLVASIRLQQASDLRSHWRALLAARDIGAGEADPDAAEHKLEDARLAAAEAAHAAAERFNQAIRHDAQWVYQANLGAALALLAQIDPTNQEYRDRAAEALRACLQGRRDAPATGWARVCIDRMVAMLAGLEQRPAADEGSGSGTTQPRGSPEADS